MNLSKVELLEDNGDLFFSEVQNKCNFIEVLDFSGCVLSDTSTNMLLKFIGSKENLKSLKLSNLDFTNFNCDDDPKDIPINCCKIICLMLDGCYFSSRIGSFFGKMIAVQDQLTILNLSHTDLSFEHSKELFIQSIEISCGSSLQCLLVQNCRFSKELAPIFGKFIGIHFNLSHLDILNCQFSNEVGKLIFENISDEFCHLKTMLYKNANIPKNMQKSFENFKKRQQYLTDMDHQNPSTEELSKILPPAFLDKIRSRLKLGLV